MTRELSAIGSILAPSLVICFKRRAENPSSLSDITAITNSHWMITLEISTTSDTAIMITMISRRRVNKFGIAYKSFGSILPFFVVTWSSTVYPCNFFLTVSFTRCPSALPFTWPITCPITFPKSFSDSAPVFLIAPSTIFSNSSSLNCSGKYS